MNSILRISSVWFCVLALAARALPSADPAAFFKDVQLATATVVTYDGDKNIMNKGSGFFINEQGHLITSNDVLKGAHSAVVITHDSNEYPVKLVLAECAESGLVKLSVDIPGDSVKFLTPASSVPKTAEQIVAADGTAKTEQAFSGGLVITGRDIPSTGKIRLTKN